MLLFSKEFWGDTAERAIKTGCQVAIAAIGTETLFYNLNYKEILSMIFLSMATSVLTSIASSKVGDKESASVLK